MFCYVMYCLIKKKPKNGKNFEFGTVFFLFLILVCNIGLVNRIVMFGFVCLSKRFPVVKFQFSCDTNLKFCVRNLLNDI